MIDHLDHLVLTTCDEAACIDFYTHVLAMQLESFVGRTPPVQRQAFKLGHQKVNLHVRGREFEPKAHLPLPEAFDQCCITSVPPDEVTARVIQAACLILEGPVMRTGATQKIHSIYLRDPDLNLIEISELV